MSADVLLIVPAALCGVAIAAIVSCIPGLHIYNIMGIIALVVFRQSGVHDAIPPEVVAGLAMGLVTGYSILNTIPAVLLSAPDESAMFTVMPGQKLFLRGRGIDAVGITTIGSAAGLILLVFVLGPFAPAILPEMQHVLRPHTHWIIWCVVAFMLMSEWPRVAPSGQSGWRRFWHACRPGFIGILVFLLSGMLGFILFYSPIVPANIAFQSLMPAFVGLFTIPWLILNIVSNLKPPPQQRTPSAIPTPTTMVSGALAGALGGGFAAFFPVVTGGVGGFLAGHATAIRDSRTFLISQGTSKLLYYAGGLLLFFVPGLGVRRGGGAWIVCGLVESGGYYKYLLALASIAISGSVALLLTMPLARVVLSAISMAGLRMISLCALAAAILISVIICGPVGLAIMAVAAGIGLLPILFGARRMNCLGIVILPVACNMSGFGPSIAHWMGLI